MQTEVYLVQKVIIPETECQVHNWRTKLINGIIKCNRRRSETNGAVITSVERNELRPEARINRADDTRISPGRCKESNAHRKLGKIQPGFSRKTRKIYAANCWPACHFERRGRKCSRKKLWRPDVSRVVSNRWLKEREIFRKLTVNDRVNLRSPRKVTASRFSSIDSGDVRRPL